MNLGDSLFSKTKQQVLRILFSDTSQSFYLNEIVRLADMGKGTVKRELDSLSKVGVLTQTKQGNQLHFKANQSCPIFLELKGIVDKTFGIHGILLFELQAIKESVLFALVFGSIAKGQESAGSDVDILLVGDNLSFSKVKTLLVLAEEQILRKINPTILTKKEFEARFKNKQSFVTRVIQQDKLWLWGEKEFIQLIDDK